VLVGPCADDMVFGLRCGCVRETIDAFRACSVRRDEIVALLVLGRRRLVAGSMAAIDAVERTELRFEVGRTAVASGLVEETVEDGREAAGGGAERLSRNL